MLVGSRANGASGSLWRTGVEMLSVNDEAAMVEVRMRVSNGEVLITTVEMGFRNELAISDVIGALGASGSVALEITSHRRAIVTSTVCV